MNFKFYLWQHEFKYGIHDFHYVTRYLSVTPLEISDWLIFPKKISSSSNFIRCSIVLRIECICFKQLAHSGYCFRFNTHWKHQLPIYEFRSFFLYNFGLNKHRLSRFLYRVAECQSVSLEIFGFSFETLRIASWFTIFLVMKNVIHRRAASSINPD